MRVQFKRKKKHIFINIFLSIAFLLATVALVQSFPPGFMIEIGNIAFSVIIVFFISIFLFIFFLVYALSGSKKHGILLSTFGISCLLFLFYKLTNPLFFILLAALFLVLELLFISKNSRKDESDSL